MRFVFPREPRGAGPERDRRERLIAHADVAPNDFEANLAQRERDGENRQRNENAVQHRFLRNAERVRRHQSHAAQSRVARSNRAKNDAENRRDCADQAEPLRANRVHDSRGRLSVLHRVVQSVRAAAIRDRRGRPNQREKSLGDHAAVKDRTRVALAFEATRQHRRLRCVKSRNCAAGNHDEKHREKRVRVRIRLKISQRIKRHFRDRERSRERFPKHRAGNAQRHQNQRNTENRIESGDDFVDRQQHRENVVDDDRARPNRRPAQRSRERKHDSVERNRVHGNAAQMFFGNFREQARRSAHERDADRHQHQRGKRDQRAFRAFPKHFADELRQAATVVAHRNCAGEEVVRRAHEHAPEHDPQVCGGTVGGAEHRTENRTEPRDVHQLNHERAPRANFHVVHTVVESFDRRRALGINPEKFGDEGAVKNVA